MRPLVREDMFVGAIVSERVCRQNYLVKVVLTAMQTLPTRACVFCAAFLFCLFVNYQNGRRRFLISVLVFSITCWFLKGFTSTLASQASQPGQPGQPIRHSQPGQAWRTNQADQPARPGEAGQSGKPASQVGGQVTT